MADWDGWVSRSQTGGFAGEKTGKDEDFEEEDVWDVDTERHDSNPETWRSQEFSASYFSRNDRTAPKAIPKLNPATNKIIRRSSAPQIIPDWEKIYGKKKPKSSWYPYGDDSHYEAYHRHKNSDEEDSPEEDDGDAVPPHEWIARKLARSQISSFSVCEGMGRTLKGRDLSQVRNAILAQTGFIE